MRALISLSDIEFIKGELTRLLPEIKSSHRVEALARGLGWNTNAALRAELVRKEMERIVDDHAFQDYLRDHGFPNVPFETLREGIVRCKFAPARAAIQVVMDGEPWLTTFGFGIYGHTRPSGVERRAKFQQKRQEMFGPWAVYEFVLSREFLSRFRRRKTINKAAGSYWLKHQAEEFYRKSGIDGLNEHIHNGMLIAAAIDLGLKVVENGPNALLNISLTLSSQRPSEKRPELVAT